MEKNSQDNGKFFKITKFSKRVEDHTCELKVLVFSKWITLRLLVGDTTALLDRFNNKGKRNFEMGTKSEPGPRFENNVRIFQISAAGRSVFFFMGTPWPTQLSEPVYRAYCAEQSTLTISHDYSCSYGTDATVASVYKKLAILSPIMPSAAKGW